jgi:hypothetical protein
VQAGAFKDTPWERVPCSRCDLIEDSSQVLEYDDQRTGSKEQSASGGNEVTEGVNLMPLSVLAHALRMVFSQSEDAFLILKMRREGRAYKEIAARLGVSVSAVELRHRRILAAQPLLAKLFPAKTRRAACRKRRAGHRSAKTASASE